jgi:signal transduction histidine kinase
LINPHGQTVHRIASLIGSARRPRGLETLLDLALVLLIASTFLQVADPDLLLHAAWVVLAAGAFLFGFRMVAWRIALGSASVFAYSWLSEHGALAVRLELAPLELTEWPLMIAIVIVVAVMAGRVEETGRRYATLYRNASDRLLTAQEEERKRLALDLHDGVGQTLTALLLALDATRDQLVRGSGPVPPTVPSGLEKARELAASALEETRDVATRLRPARISGIGIATAVRELAAMSSRPVEVTIAREVDRPGLLTPDVEINLFRIAQEALANAIRHSRSDHIGIRIDRGPEGLRLEVSDRGRGFDAAVSEGLGLGLAGMRERAASAGARLELESSPGTGTTIAVTVPMDSADPEPLSSPATMLDPSHERLVP